MIDELNVDQRNYLYEYLDLRQDITILDLDNLDLRRTSNPFSKHIIASGLIINADGRGRTLEIDFMNEDPEKPAFFRHSHCSEDYTHEQHHDVNVISTKLIA